MSLVDPNSYLLLSTGVFAGAVVSGLVGGLMAMPGALPAIWCDLRGMSKDRQRGMVQPYIAAMQLLALALLLSHNGLSRGVVFTV